MNESDLRDKWESEKSVYAAWGEYVVNLITKELELRDQNINEFLKVPATYRLKDDDSLIDKAFCRPNKGYFDPYNEIEDKVGARFIVLLIDDIKVICDIVQECYKWDFDACKHFDEDKEKDPLLFTYQSVHYILRPKIDITVNKITIPISTPCEVQIRTLLQHAHAELTHDAIYKSKRTIQPKIHRTVAKSMALIETADDFFTAVTQQLNHGPLEEYGIIKRLDGLYLSFTGMESHIQKSSIVIFDVFEQFINETLVDKIQSFIGNDKYSFLSKTIKDRYSDNIIYQQSTVLFIYWMLTFRKRRLLMDWPLEKGILEPLSVDLGISTWDD